MTSKYCMQVIGLHDGGYGLLLGQAMFCARKLYALFVSLATANDNFAVVPIIALPRRPNGGSYDLDYIRSNIVNKSNRYGLVISPSGTLSPLLSRRLSCPALQVCNLFYSILLHLLHS